MSLAQLFQVVLRRLLNSLDDTLTSLVLRVKGLNPPGKKDYNQNTPFSGSIVCDGGGCDPLI